MKRFHLGDVLSIITGRIVSTRQIDGVVDILNFMTGDNLFTRQIPRAIEKCQPYLIEQFPQFATPEINLATAELDEILKTKSEKVETKKLIACWLENQIAKHGKMFTVKSIPGARNGAKDLIAEDSTILDIKNVSTILNIK